MKAKNYIILLLICFLLIGSSLVLAVEPQYGGVLHVGDDKIQASLDPHHNMGIGGMELFMTYNTLISYDQELNFVPELANSWEIPDNTTYIFHLREGVRFHDGSEFDAEAVKWNLQRMMSEYSEIKAYFNIVNEIEIIDKYTIKIKLAKPYAPFMDSIAGVGYIVSPAAVEKMGNEGFQKHPVGTGPFKFAKYDSQNGELVFEKNKQYWQKGKPYLDKVVFTEIPEEQTSIFALKTGKVDLLSQLPASSINEFKIMQMKENSKFKIASLLAKSNTIDYFTFNCSKPPFNDKRVRLAVSYALDNDMINAFLENSEPIPGPLPATSWGSSPNLPVFEYNPEKSKELLAEAGYPNGLEVTLKFWSNDQLRSDLAVVAQQMLSEAGIKVKIEVMEVAALIQQIMNNDFEFVSLHWGGNGSLDPNGNLHVLFSSEGQNNWIANYHNEQVDKYLQLALDSTDRKERQELYWKAEEIIVADQPMIWFGRFLSYLGYSTRLHGVEPLRPSGYTPIMENVWIEN